MQWQLCRACSLAGQTLTHPAWESGQRYRAWWRRKVSFMYAHNVCPHPHTHISMSGVDSSSLLRHRVLSDTPTECVTQCANIPSLKQNTIHHANHALRTCAWNHLHLRATLFHNYTIKQRGVCLHWRLLVGIVCSNKVLLAWVHEKCQTVWVCGI